MCPKYDPNEAREACPQTFSALKHFLNSFSELQSTTAATSVHKTWKQSLRQTQSSYA